MEQKPQKPPGWRLALLALSLMAVAGWVDAVGYLTLAHIYTANMSGNSISLGAQTAAGPTVDVLRRGWPIIWFFVGLLIAAAFHEVLSRRTQTPSLAGLLAIEAALLVLFTIGMWLLEPHPTEHLPLWIFCILGALASCAMGVQNGSLRRAGALSLHTTHITGLLLQCADAIVLTVATWRSRSRRPQALIDAIFLASLWVGYVVAAFLGALTLFRLGPWTLVPSIAVLLLWIAVEMARPGG